MKTKPRMINGEKFIPVSKETAKIFQNANVKLYKIGEMKTLFIKVNEKN